MSLPVFPSGVEGSVLEGCEPFEKSLHDPFQYAAMLANGEVIIYHHAVMLNKNWVLLETEAESSSMPHAFSNMTCERGIAVRADQIICVIDAPYGS